MLPYRGAYLVPQKVNALLPEIREQECDHASGLPFTGKIPCTGPQVCLMCGTRKEEKDGETKLPIQRLPGTGQ